MKIITITSREDAKDFENIIKKMPAFVKIFSPSCGHCVAMAPAWEKLKEDNNLKNLDFALIEINSSVASNMKSSGVKHFEGVPTIREIKQGNGAAGKEYKGNRSAEDMANFIKKTFKPSSLNNVRSISIEQNGGSKKSKKNNRKNKKTKKGKKSKKSRKTKKSCWW